MAGLSQSPRSGTLAIDLGSSTTVVAWQADGQSPQLLSLAPYSLDDPPLVPTLLWQSSPDQATPLIGRQVLDAHRADGSEPGLCRDFKRSIGAGLGPTDRSWLSPEQAGALLLRRLWEALPVGLDPRRLVLTAPVEAYQGYRQWLQQASIDLPVSEVALVDEPTAAAIGSGLPPGARVLVVDVGGGTIDLSLVALDGGEGRAAPIAQLLRFAGRDLLRSGQALRCARVIGKAGLPIGGRDIDRWILEALMPEGFLVPPLPARLLRLAEELKCQLSDGEEAMRVWLPPEGGAQELRLSRRTLEQLLHRHGLIEALDGLLESVRAAARREGSDLATIDAVLPVGGGSRIPLIRRWLQERCAGIPLRDERPVEAVALGALALTPGVRLRDVLARGVALRCWDRRSGGHHWHPLFVAGQSWPTDQPLELVLACSRDGQRQMELVLGEPLAEERAEVVFEAGLPRLRRRAAGAGPVSPWPGAAPHLDLDPPGQVGHDRLRLAFAIDGQGQLVVGGQDLLSDRPLPTLTLGPVR
ncbi:MAG: Hsp70 family protein [Cyanobacteriota bacterium]|nr:Hsp70 family protein [Cyanobacteriota bacterium]